MTKSKTFLGLSLAIPPVFSPRSWVRVHAPHGPPTPDTHARTAFAFTAQCVARSGPTCTLPPTTYQLQAYAKRLSLTPAGLRWCGLCAGQSCANPPAPGNGTRGSGGGSCDITSLADGATCTITCNDGYSKAGGANKKHKCTSGSLTLARCDENVCACTNGVGDRNGACNQHEASECASCNVGYRLSSDNTSCAENTCTCTTGGASSGTRANKDTTIKCTTHGANICAACKSAYDHNSTAATCTIKKCTCTNGVGTTGANCNVTGTHICKSCSSGYTLSSTTKKCELNKCACSDGNGTTGTECSSHGAQVCASCSEKFWMTSEKKCEACTNCQSGKFESSSCETAKDASCASCTPVKNAKQDTQVNCTKASDSQIATCATEFKLTDNKLGDKADVCTACANCTAGKYKASACQGTADTVCNTCTAVANAHDTAKLTCTTSSDSQIDQCKDGYDLIQSSQQQKADVCTLRQCTCNCAADSGCNGVSKGQPIGVAANGTACKEKGKFLCTKCTAPSYTLNTGNKQCEPKSCTCENGSPATGTDCKSQGQAKCASCKSGYTVSSDKSKCEPNACKKGAQASMQFNITTDNVTLQTDLSSGGTRKVDCINWHKGYRGEIPVACKLGTLSLNWTHSCQWYNPCSKDEDKDCSGEGHICTHTGPGQHECSCSSNRFGDGKKNGTSCTQCQDNSATVVGESNKEQPACKCNEGYSASGKECKPLPCPTNSTGSGGPGANACACSASFYKIGDGPVWLETKKFATDGCKACSPLENMPADATIRCTGANDSTVDKCKTGFYLAKQNTTCEPNQCKCANGNGTTNVACPDLEKATCASCDTGYYLENKACKKNNCECSGGVAAQGSLCWGDGKDVCVKCTSDAQHLEEQADLQVFCKANACKCQKGTAASGSACKEHEGRICSSCDVGFKLNQTTKSCVPNMCKCENGTPKRGDDEDSEYRCGADGSAGCKKCDSGYSLSSDKAQCNSNKCKCSNGQTVNGTDCKTDGLEHCSKCNDGYFFVAEGSAIKCNQCSTCSKGQYKSGGCSGNKTTECSNCTAVKFASNVSKIECTSASNSRLVSDSKCADTFVYNQAGNADVCECKPGQSVADGTCVTNQCSCLNGKSVNAGINCTKHLANECTKCDTDYILSNRNCVSKCNCQNGKTTQACKTAKFDSCATCNTGNFLQGSRLFLRFDQKSCVPCAKNVTCPVGRGLLPCSDKNDEVCQNCTERKTFSNGTGSGQCQTCSGNCDNGFYLSENCTVKADRKCTACPLPKGAKSGNNGVVYICKNGKEPATAAAPYKAKLELEGDVATLNGNENARKEFEKKFAEDLANHLKAAGLDIDPSKIKILSINVSAVVPIHVSQPQSLNTHTVLV